MHFEVEVTKGQVLSDHWNPADYVYGGITAFDAQTAWVVGNKRNSSDHPELPWGIILHTNDGVNWTSQKLPVDDVELWKVSFVGAHR